MPIQPNFTHIAIRFVVATITLAVIGTAFSCTDSLQSLQSDPPPAELLGTWEYKDLIWYEDATSDTMIFIPHVPRLHDWGMRIKFNADNTCRSSYSAWCGNDDNIHSYSGRYIYNSGSRKVTGDIRFMKQNNEFTIATVTKDSLIIVMKR
ncbi:MAG: hypothetical protein JNL32_11275 [Candidatus Kapabacteria bacterium]|nr:hypothetical protein [Candidatus Kapabacteria bacterium]